MPTYEYQCDACGHEFEREQRITEDPIKACPSCKARKARRLISRTSFVLKGSGWYSDLYSSPGAKKDAAKEGSKGDDKGTTSEKSDSKSADASSSKSDSPKESSSSGGTSKSGTSKGKSRSAA